MEIEYTTGQVAEIAGVSEATIRNSWCREFGDFLSDSAMPDPGQQRFFTVGDLEVMNTVATMRKARKSYKVIYQELESGIRMPLDNPPPPPPRKTVETAQKGANLPDIGQRFGQALQVYEKQIDGLQKQLNETTNRLIDAEKRASAAEAEARLLREISNQASDPTAGDADTPRRVWWKFWSTE